MATPLAAIAATLLLAPASAALTPQSVAGPITIYVAGTAGGGIDLFARLVGRHRGRHIPGRPAQRAS